MLHRLQKKWTRRYHQQMYDWHCKTFFPFHRQLNPSAQAYLKSHFQRDERHTPLSVVPHTTWPLFLYSHVCRNGHLNSSFLMVGSAVSVEQVSKSKDPNQKLLLAAAALREVQVDLSVWPLAQDLLSFWGLGWDINSRRVSIWWEVEAFSDLLFPEAQRLRIDVANEGGSLGGLVGVWLEDGKWVDTCMIAFPRAQMRQPEREKVSWTLLLHSAQHGMIKVTPSVPAAMRQPLLNQAGRRLMSLYQQKGESVRKIAVTDANHFTVLFP